jgi:hypothetical protein
MAMLPMLSTGQVLLLSKENYDRYYDNMVRVQKLGVEVICEKAHAVVGQGAGQREIYARRVPRQQVSHHKSTGRRVDEQIA